MDLNEARAEVRSWQKEQVSRKKKRSHSGSDNDNSDSDNSGEPSWKKKKRANHKDRLKNEEEEEDVGQHLTSYRDRANERREGDNGIEDISAYLQKNIVKHTALAPIPASNKRKHAVTSLSSETNGSQSHLSVKREKLPTTTTTTTTNTTPRTTTKSLGARILRTLKTMENLTMQISPKSLHIKTSTADPWLEGSSVVYHFNIHPHPSLYDQRETPTVVMSSASSNNNQVGRDNVGLTLPDRQKHPALSTRLLEVIDTAVDRSCRGLTDPHPMLLRRKERERQVSEEKKKSIQLELDKKKKEIAALMATDTEELLTPQVSKENGDVVADDIFYEAGDYKPVVVEEEVVEVVEVVDDDNLIGLGLVGVLPPSELNIGFERPIKLHAGESVQIDRRSKSTPLGLDNTNFTSQHIRKGDVAYYTKQNVGTDCLQVLLVHPGSPAPVESLSTVVTHSHDIVRIGRELNVMPSSECFHLTLKEDEIVLLLPLHFRQRVLDIKSNKLSSKDSMLTLELDLINHVLEGRAK